MNSPQTFDSMLTARDIIHAWANRTFPGRNPAASLSKLVMEEIPELLTAKKEGRPLDGEMADCFILLLDLCALWKIDPAMAIYRKMCINETRVWKEDKETGFFNHIEHDPPPLTSGQMRQMVDKMVTTAKENPGWYDPDCQCVNCVRYRSGAMT